MPSGPSATLAAWAPRSLGSRSTAPPRPARRATRRPGRWVAPVRFVELIDGPALAGWAGALARRVRPALPAPRQPGGAPRAYRDETILLTLLVLRTWRPSLEQMADWLARYEALALALGYAPAARPSAPPSFRAAVATWACGPTSSSAWPWPGSGCAWVPAPAAR